MAKFMNVSPLGALDIPVLGKIVEAGEVFEVSKDMAQYFAGQTANFKQINDRPAGRKSKTEPSSSQGKGVAPTGADDGTDEKEDDR